MGDCSPEVLATSILQQRPSIVQTNSMLQKINKQIKGQKFFAHMTEIRGEAVHICARIILKYEKGKKVKTTIKLSKVMKMNDYTGLSVYTSR